MTTPIIGLHHIALLVPDLRAAVADYEALLGALAHRVDDGGVAFHLANVTIVLRAGRGPGGLGLICFEVDEPARMARRLKRLGIRSVPGASEEIVEIDRDQTCAIPLGYASERRRRPTADAAVSGLDHVVLATQEPDRAAALYGARLGLDLRFDTTRPDWGARLMFFRCGDLVLEIVHNLQNELSGADDRLHGFSWRTVNAEKTHARLTQQGFALSEIRPGRRPGTRVFTVRGRTAGVPTVFLESPTVTG